MLSRIEDPDIEPHFDGATGCSEIHADLQHPERSKRTDGNVDIRFKLNVERFLRL